MLAHYKEAGGRTKKSFHSHKWLSPDVTLWGLLADLDTGEPDNGTLPGWPVFALGLAFLSVCEVTWRLNYRGKGKSYYLNVLNSYPGV